jgi:hypothetical protein
MSRCRLAISESTFRELFTVLRDQLVVATSGSKDWGPFDVEWDIRFHLEEGAVDFTGDNSVRVDELDIIFDRLRINLLVNIPKLCVGGQCVVPNLWGGCAVRLPKLCVFKSNPDATIRLNLDGLIRSEVTGEFVTHTEYFVNPDRPAEMSDHEAFAADLSNKWQVFLSSLWLDIDPIDVPGTVQAIYDAAVDSAVNTLLAPLPGWAKDAVIAILGAIGDVIEGILDVGDDIQEWVADFLNFSLSILNFATQQVVYFFAGQYAVFQFKDLFRIMDAKGPFIPVLVPFENVAAWFTEDEMIVNAEPA